MQAHGDALTDGDACLRAAYSASSGVLSFVQRSALRMAERRRLERIASDWR
jgi:hypothetical protein